MFETKYGYFSQDGKEYIIKTPETPRPWINVISNGDYGIVVSQSGSGYSWRTHASLNRITRWEQDLVKDEWGKYIYIKDNENDEFWSPSWKPICKKPQEFKVRHGQGYSIFETKYFDIKTELTMFVAKDEPIEIWKLKIKNLLLFFQRIYSQYYYKLIWYHTYNFLHTNLVFLHHCSLHYLQ